VSLIRKLWSEDRVSFNGGFYTTDSATIYDKPERMPPVYIAGVGPMTAKYTGRVAEGFICTSGKPSELCSETPRPTVAAGLGAAGRAPTT